MQSTTLFTCPKFGVHYKANRKIFLFPENWLEPEFRDDKTHLFAELEGTLLQDDVSSDLVEDAFLTYLRKLDELARLDIVAMHREDKADMAQNTLHVIGRTHGEPHKYFYRRYTHEMWSPWEPVTAEIEGDHLAPVVWRDRLYLFWVTFMEKPKLDKEARTLDLPATIPATETELEARLHWSEYIQGEWTVRESGALDPDSEQVLKTDTKHKYQPTPTTSTEGPRLVFVTNYTPRMISIHVSKEPPDENGQERGVYIHLSLPFNKAFYLAGRNSSPEKRAFNSALPNPYSARTINATQYAGRGAFRVNFNSRVSIQSIPLQETVETQTILGQNNGSYTILSCNNDIPREDDIAAVMKPLFYQDSRQTFFVEPNVTQQTILEFGRWAAEPPTVTLDVSPILLEEVEVSGVGQILHIPTPDDRALLAVKPGGDWLVNPATSAVFDETLIGPRGGLEAVIQPTNQIGVLSAAGEILAVHPGSSVAPGSTLVLLGSLEKTGLQREIGGLNVIGAAGLNRSLIENIEVHTEGVGHGPFARR